MKFKLLACIFVALWNASALAQIGPGWAVMEDTNRAADVLNSGTPTGSFTIPDERGFTVPGETEESGGPSIAPMSAITGSADAITPEIAELAKGLENNPVEIFNHVFNHIDYDHYFGSKKGALMTLQEGRGNSFDTAALLVALLRSAGYTAGYRYGPAQFSFSELSNWCNFKLTPYDQLSEPDFRLKFNLVGVNLPFSDLKKYVYVFNFNDQRGFPYTDCGDLGAGANYYQIPHVWVRVTVGTQTWEVDPSFKMYTHYAKQDVKSIADFNRTDFLNDIGGTPGTNSVTGILTTTLGDRLTSYSTNIRNWIKNNNSGIWTDAFTGGPRIIQREITGFNEAWAVLYASRPWLSVTPWESTIPAEMMSRYEITSGVQASDGTFTPGSMSTSVQMPVLNARKMALTFSGNTANLQLDDAAWETFSVSDSTVDLMIKAVHPFYDFQYNFTSGTFETVNVGRGDQQEIKRYKKGDAIAYTFIYGFQNPAMHLRKRQEQLDKYRRLGYGDTDLRVKTEILNVMGLTWLMELEMSDYLLATQVDVARVYQHRFGRVAQEDNFYIDAGLNLESIQARSGDQLEHDIYLTLGSMFGSAMEHGVLEQLQGTSVVGASTIKMLDLANSTNVPIYRSTSANWSGPGGVKAQLVNYPSTALIEIEDSILNRGGAVLIPKNGSLILNNWSGYGYYLSEALMANFKISGGLKGGYSTSSGVVDTFTLAQWLASDSSYLWAASALLNIGSQPATTPTYFGADPVEMATGAFVVNREEMNLGGRAPLGLSFSRHYHSGNNYSKTGGMGFGWTHNYNMYVSQSAGIKAGLGQTTAAHMSPYLAACAVAAEIQRSGSNTPKEMTTMALIAKWAVDQLRTNGVGVVIGNQTYQFVKMPDGSYEPPAGSKATLEVISNDFVLKERHSLTYTFDSTNGNRIKTITDQSGNAQTFIYTGGKLSTVSDQYGRTLTFGYSGGDKITSVSDGSRTANFGYTGDTLTTATDVENKSYTYTYDGENRINILRDPNNRIITQNTYDATGRVDTQMSMGDTNRLWHFYYTGYCNIEVDPAEGQKLYFYDERGRCTGNMDPLGNFEGRVYDGQDRITATLTPKSETSYYTFNADHNLVTETDPLNEVTTYFYDTQLRLQKVIDKRNNETNYTYTTTHKLKTVTDQLDHTTTYDYYPDGGSVGLLLDVIDAENKKTTYGYDTWGQINKITDQDQKSRNFVNNNRGDILTATDPENRTVTNTYNKRRQLLTSTLPTVPGEPIAVTTNTFDDSGNLQNTTDAKSNLTSFTYNSLGQKITTTLPNLPAGGNVISNTYDFRDWLETASDSLNHTVTTEYDAAHRVFASIDPLNHRTEYQHDANGQTTAIKDPLLRITQQSWTPRGEKERDTDALNKYSESFYDNNRNPTDYTNRRRKLYHSIYDDANRLESSATPTLKTTGMTYYDNNLVKTIREPSAQTTTFIYNGRNLVQTKTDQVGAIGYTYDDSGMVKTVTEGAATISRTYDERGRLKTFTNADGDVLQYKYDANGNLNRITYPPDDANPLGKQVNYTYDSRNLLETVTDWQNRTTTYVYDQLGRLTDIQRPNQTQLTIARDDAGRVLNLRERKNSTLFNYIQLGYDDAGQVKQRFQAPMVNSGWQHPTITGTYDDDNRLLTVNGSSVSHDDDGNMTNGPIAPTSGNVTVTYNSRNQLVTAGGLTYTYDAEGTRRTLSDPSGTTRDVIDPRTNSLLVRHQPNGAKTYYVYGVGLLYEVDEAENTKTYHFDQVGSTIARTNDTGAVIGTAEYSAYGLIIQQTGNMDTPFLYNGKYGVQTDPNGLLNMRARYYSPYLMRFLNADPIGFSGSSNWFAYGVGNPSEEDSWKAW